MFKQLKDFKDGEYFLAFHYLTNHRKAIFKKKFEERKCIFKCDLVYPIKGYASFRGIDVLEKIILCKLCDDLACEIKPLSKCECFELCLQ